MGDFAVGAKGRDLVSLAAYLFAPRPRMQGAPRRLAGMLGIDDG